MWASLLLLGVVAWTAWRPVEVVPFTGPLIAFALLALLPHAWSRTRWSPSAWWWAVAAGWLVASAALSWDRSRAVGQLGLLAAVAALAWVASRSRPDPRLWRWWALAMAGLAVWGGWQVLSGFAAAREQLDLLPAALREAALHRLDTRRAFASLPVPGHLAALLATTVPLLMPGGDRRSRWAWLAPLALVAAGLLLTRSVIGVALALGAALVLALRQRPALVLPVGLVTLVSGAVLLLGRSDLGRLQPLLLRWDNWRTAGWVWWSSPVTGVGLGGLGQASQGVPFPVGNQTAYAHALPLQWLAELGPLGLVLVAAGALALVRLVIRLWARSPGVAVALVVIPLHNLVDFSLYVSGVAVPWALLLGWAIAEGRGEDAPPASASERWRPLAVAAAASMTALTLLHATGVQLEWRAARLQSPADRVELAIRAQRLAPWRVEPAFLAGAAALGSGRPEDLQAARAAVDRAARLRPRSASLATLRAHLGLGAGDLAAAAQASHAATRFSPGASADHAALVQALETAAR